MNSDQLYLLLENLPAKSHRKTVANRNVQLSREMADALGYSSYKVITVLNAVIDAIADKMRVTSITASDALVQDSVTLWLAQNGWANLQKDLFKLVVRDGEAFILSTFADDMPHYTLREAYDGRQGAAYVYGDNDEVLYAVNVWCEKNVKNVDLYYPDRIETYQSTAGAAFEPRRDTEHWPIDWTDSAGEPLGIALTRYDIGESDIEDAVQLQMFINDAIIDLMATSKTMGWPQRFLKGTTNPEFIADQYGQLLISVVGTPYRRSLTLTPGSIFMLQGKESELGQLDAASTDTTVVDKLLHLISLVTTVPMHYFSGDWPSGEALIQSETRLNHKVESHQSELTPALVDMLRLSLRLSNTYANTQLDTQALITVTWKSPEIETAGLELDRLTKTAQALTLFNAAGALSTDTMVRTAMRLLNPDATEAEIQAEIARVVAQRQLVTL